MSEVTVLEGMLADARNRERPKRRAELKGKLREVRASLRDATARYDALASCILSERELRARLQDRLGMAQEKIAESWNNRPRAADYLDDDDDDAEVAAWRRAHAALEAERGQLVRQRDAVPSSDQLEAVQLKSMIERLQHAERALFNALDALNDSN